MRSCSLKNATLFLCLLLPYFLVAQNIDGPTMWPRPSTTLPKNILHNGQPLVFTGSSYNPFLGLDHAYVVIVPPQFYDEPNRVFPVMYNWHGTSPGSTGVGLVGSSDPNDVDYRAHIAIQQIEQGNVVPYISVWPSTGPNLAVGPVEKWLVEIFMPFVEQTFRASNRGEQRGMTGESMGGGITLRMSMCYPEEWAFWMNTIASYTPIEQNSFNPNNHHYNQWLFGIRPFVDEYLIDADPGLSVWERTNSGRSWYSLMTTMGTPWDTLPSQNCGHDATCTHREFRTEFASFMERNFVKVLQTKTQGSNLVREGGANDTIWFHLDRAPSGTVNITANPETQLSVSPMVLTFTDTDWNTPKPLVVSAVDDNEANGFRRALIRYTVSSSDPKFNNTRVFVSRVMISDDESPTTVGFVKHKMGVNAPIMNYSGGYTIYEHSELNDKANGWDDTLAFPKNLKLVLALGIENPIPHANYEVKVSLSEKRLNQSIEWTPAFATSEDLHGFTEETVRFNAGEFYKDFTIRPTQDDIQEGTEVAEFALSCATGSSELGIGEHNIAHIGLQDWQLNRTQTPQNIIISEVWRGKDPGQFAIELFNTHHRDVSISGYNLRILPQGQTDWANAIQIKDLQAPAGNSMRSHDVLILGSPLLEKRSVAGMATHLFYDQLANVGPYDAIGLFRNNTLLDVVGFANMPSEGIRVADVDSANFKVMIRKPEVFSPNSNFEGQIGTTFQASEWMVEKAGYSNFLGYHVVQSGTYSRLVDNSSTDPCIASNLPETIKGGNIFLFPNPANRSLTLKWTGNSGLENAMLHYAIYSSEGRVVAQGRTQLNQEINISGLTKGLYLIQLRTAQGNMVTKQFVKE